VLIVDWCVPLKTSEIWSVLTTWCRMKSYTWVQTAALSTAWS